jgi:Protein of unknown function (DUF1553)/Protein of unknown function (DUF1549)/Planctomycete cytochrome C
VNILLLSIGWIVLQVSEPVDFVRDVRPIFEKHCYDCHSATEQESGLRLDAKALAFKGGDNHGPDIVPGNAAGSPLIQFVTAEDADKVMPPGGQLSAGEIEILRRWVNEGAQWPEGVDKVQLKDTRDHWSFKALKAPTMVDGEPASSRSIDVLIEAKLAENSLRLSPEADRVTWLRRTTFDLTGLPPTPAQVRGFLQDNRSDAYERVIDDLLSSQRYGERWAQHWLDLVRFADTHGFEVNTERPNAWPYRDYVIRSFNNDTPYDRFIREQIVGDAMGEDAATGFLVTASVLLPGQIGQDAPSKRLARQDALDEIVNNIGQTFLGLSIGCARCHDHKFDPITAKDYYAMQAFVAGVEYEERKMRTADSEQMERDAQQLRMEIAAIDSRLAKFSPMANPPGPRAPQPPRVINATNNVEVFPPIDARWVRFTIHDSNLHPDLGLIEPCIDEFEILTDQPEPVNVALASQGTQVSASGSQHSTSHQLVHINDGLYGNERSWMADSRGQGWVLFELPQATRIGKVVWSRDRKGQYTDRLATAFTLEAGLSMDNLVTLSQIKPLRPMLQPTLNIDRIEPTKTQRLRFTILTTSNLEPCIDELEVFDTAGENVALASCGTQVKTSSDKIDPGRHEPLFINDGRYGNSRSWLSNELNQGWIELEFTQEVEIERVVWGRDREGKFTDRLATSYRIEIAGEGDWKLVADSSDRIPFVAGTSPSTSINTTGLPPAEAAAATELSKQKVELESKLKQLESAQLVFAGRFRAPDEIHLLTRGDPEQPNEEVAPAVIEALDDVCLATATPDQERRRVLADWIASPTNPLTARVMVNRIWQGHFGSGLVQTPSDYGNNGMQPSHPELLDWLAIEFIRSGWSIKHMHRLILLSKTYRQTSLPNPLAAAVDADVRLLWRYPSRRIEAESIRDSMLAVSGLLDLKMYGRGYDLFDLRGGLSGFNPVEKLTSENQRRMIYAHKVRRETEAVFGAFDCPDAGQSAALRRMSTTPIQALNLFNSQFTLALSQAFAQRVQREAGDNLIEQIQLAYRLALSRAASPEELQLIEPVVREHGLVVLGRVLFNSNEFLLIP